MRGEQEAILLRGDGRNVLQLERVADDDRAARAKQERERRGDVALAGFVDDDEVEEAGLEGEAAARGERGDRPAWQRIDNLREEAVVPAEDLLPRPVVAVLAIGDDLQERDVLAQELALRRRPAARPEADPSPPKLERVPRGVLRDARELAGQVFERARLAGSIGRLPVGMGALGEVEAIGEGAVEVGP